MTVTLLCINETRKFELKLCQSSITQCLGGDIIGNNQDDIISQKK